MEERGPPATGAAGDTNDEPAPTSETQLVPYGPNGANDTYVIHFPKDQIYRVPPPENAIIVEKHRPVPKKKRSCCKCCCLALLVIFLVLFLIVGMTVTTWYFVLSPKSPTFSVTQMNVKKPASKDSDVVGYEIFLSAGNPNKMSIRFEGGETSLSNGEKSIAKGKYPSDDLGDHQSDVVKLVLNGTMALPDDVQDSLGGTGSNKTSPLSLNLKTSELPLHIKYGSFRSWDKKVGVECKFKVDTFGSGTKVLQQNCDTTLK